MEQVARITFAVIALILLGFPLRAFAKKIGIPPAASLMFLGALVGPSCFDLLPNDYRDFASNLSKAAFALLLLRAGVGLVPSAIRKIAWPVLLFGTIPVLFEFGAVAIGAKFFLFERRSLWILAGFLAAAVSPAVILPTMLEQKSRGLGGPNLVPDRIMGQTIVNSLFAATGIDFVLWHYDYGIPGVANIQPLYYLPLKVIAGVIIGIAVSYLMPRFFFLASKDDDRVHATLGARLAPMAVLAIGITCYFMASYGFAKGRFDPVFAVLSLGVVLGARLGENSSVLAQPLAKMWSYAEVILFANLGSIIQLDQLQNFPLIAKLLALLMGALAIRLLVTRAMAKFTKLSRGESLYLTLGQIPKATVQAVFGPLIYAALIVNEHPLLRDAAQVLLLMAVLAILATAPIGAVVLDRWAKKLLVSNGESQSES